MVEIIKNVIVYGVVGLVTISFIAVFIMMIKEHLRDILGLLTIVSIIWLIIYSFNRIFG